MAFLKIDIPFWGNFRKFSRLWEKIEAKIAFLKCMFNPNCMNVEEFDPFFPRIPKLSFVLVSCNFLALEGNSKIISLLIWQHCLAANN
jgi:hypothetical protein